VQGKSECDCHIIDGIYIVRCDKHEMGKHFVYRVMLLGGFILGFITGYVVFG